MAIFLTLLVGCVDLPAGSLPPDDPGWDKALEEADNESYQPPLPDCIKTDTGSAPSANEPKEIYYYVTTNCQYCKKLEKDVADCKLYKFIKAKPDKWSKAHESDGYPMLRWEVDGKWNGKQHGWTNLDDFVRRYDRSQSSAATVSLRPGQVSSKSRVVETGRSLRQLATPDSRETQGQVRQRVVEKSVVRGNPVPAQRRSRGSRELEQRRQVVKGCPTC